MTKAGHILANPADREMSPCRRDCPACEEESRPYRFHQMKHVVSAIIRNPLEQYFTQLRKKKDENDPYGDSWELPGGKVEEGETLEVAIRREIMEEIKVGKMMRDFTRSYVPPLIVNVKSYFTSIVVNSLRNNEEFFIHYYLVGIHWSPRGSWFTDLETPTAKQYKWIDASEAKTIGMLYPDSEVLQIFDADSKSKKGAGNVG